MAKSVSPRSGATAEMFYLTTIGDENSFISAWAKKTTCCHSLALRSSKCSNILSDKDRWWGRVIISAKLKSRSTGAEDGRSRTALCCTKSFFTMGYLFNISKSLLSSRNCSTSRSHLFIGIWQWRTQDLSWGCTPKSLGSEYKHSTQAGFLSSHGVPWGSDRHIPVVTQTWPDSFGFWRTEHSPAALTS